MASDSRALTLKLLADTADFQKKLKDGSKDVDDIGERAKEFGKKAAAAFAVAGAAIGAFAVSAVKAAAEDETAQKRLAATIEATTGATAKQIEGVEEYIKQTSIAIGVADDGLRPAFTRLVRSTQDVEEAQKLLNLALDLSAATGKPLETVTNALGKAYDGNTSALGKLGLGIDAADLKSQDFDTTFNQLTATFGQFAENEAETTTKQMERVKIALDEAKESIGAALLPVVQELTAWILENFIPALEAFISGLTGTDGLNEGLTESQKVAVEWGKKVRGFINTVIDLKDELFLVAGVLATVFVVSKIAAGIQATIALITGLITAYNLLRNSAVAAAIASRFALNPLAGLATGAAVVGAIIAAVKLFDNQAAAANGTGSNTVSSASLPEGFAAGTAITGSASAGGGIITGGGLTSGGTASGSNAAISTPTQTLIEQVSEANFIKRTAGTGSFDIAGVRRADERGNVVINVNAPSAIDEEGFTRAVVLALNNSNARNGGGGAILGGLVAQ
ncbi:MAG: CAMP factor family pore-forming toxin [Candidatus Nanopelagicaceae bacterium]